MGPETARRLGFALTLAGGGLAMVAPTPNASAAAPSPLPAVYPTQLDFTLGVLGREFLDTRAELTPRQTWLELGASDNTLMLSYNLLGLEGLFQLADPPPPRHPRPPGALARCIAMGLELPPADSLAARPMDEAMARIERFEASVRAARGQAYRRPYGSDLLTLTAQQVEPGTIDLASDVQDPIAAFAQPQDRAVLQGLELLAPTVRCTPTTTSALSSSRRGHRIWSRR
jgi:hypothetical protein